jgi:RNA polymerase sigma-70 factor (ECF subfamily)
MEEREAEAALASDDAADPHQQIERALRDEEIQCAVLALPEPYRTVVLLRYMEEMPYEAIAAALEMPLGTIKTVLHRARQRLRAALTKSDR